MTIKGNRSGSAAAGGSGDQVLCAGLMLAVALAVIPALRPVKPARAPPGVRQVVDDRGIRVSLPERLGNAAVLFPPSIGDYLLVSERPRSVATAFAFNRNQLRYGVLGRMFPEARPSTYFRDGGPQSANQERLLKLQPDAVFANTGSADTFTRLGLSTLAIANNGDLNYSIEVERISAEANGEFAKPAQLLNDYHVSMHRLQGDLFSLDPKMSPRVAIIFNYQGHITGFGEADFQTSMIRAAGGHNALGPAQSVHLDRERLLAIDPDVILTMNTYPPSALPSELRNDRAWSALSAVRNRRVYAIMPALDFFPEGLVGLPLYARWMAELLHPELPAKLRGEMRAAYQRQSGYKMTDRDLDEALAMSVNGSEADYGRFGSRQ